MSVSSCRPIKVWPSQSRVPLQSRPVTGIRNPAWPGPVIKVRTTRSRRSRIQIECMGWPRAIRWGEMAKITVEAARITPEG
jgi:hypothetical protein